MKKMKKIFLLLLVIAFITVNFGCAAHGPPPTTQQIHDELAADVTDAVGASIAFSKNPKAQAQRITAVAKQIKQAAVSTADLSDLRKVATEIVLHAVSEDDRAVARFATNLIFNRLKRHLNLDLALVPIDRYPEVRALLSDLSDAAIDAAKGYQ